MLAQSMGAETLGLRSRRALSFTAHASFTQPNLEIRTRKSLNPLARGRVNLIRPRVGQFESTGGTLRVGMPSGRILPVLPLGM